MNGVSKTALWTAMARARDAQKKKPVCGDAYASRFADAENEAIVRDLLALRRPSESIAMRHRMIDDVVRGHLARRPDQLVVLLGAGLDTRAYRMGAGRYVEVDQPALFAWKEPRLPLAEAPRPLERIGIDFDRETLHDRLQHLATDEPVVVIAEGLFPYLDPGSVQSVFTTLKTLFPSHVIIADVLSRGFLKRFGHELMPVLRRHGIDFTTRPENPRALFEDAGYREVETMSSLEKMMRPPRIVRWLLRDLYEGNVVCIGTMS